MAFLLGGGGGGCIPLKMAWRRRGMSYHCLRGAAGMPKPAGAKFIDKCWPWAIKSLGSYTYKQDFGP